MKSFKIFSLAMMLLVALTGCGEKEGGKGVKVAGEWQLVQWNDATPEFKVYIDFNADGTFEMFQKVGDGPYWYTQGEYMLDAATKILSGVYSDRYPWKYSYKVSISDKTLEMAAVELEGYKLTYAKETIPAQVREKSLPLTKSESVELFL